MEHTPGPWEYTGVHVIDARGEVVLIDGVSLAIGRVDPAGEAVSNARLIAAAPDLLGALKDLENYCRERFVTYNERATYVMDQAEKAIAKAEGRT